MIEIDVEHDTAVVALLVAEFVVLPPLDVVRARLEAQLREERGEGLVRGEPHDARQPVAGDGRPGVGLNGVDSGPRKCIASPPRGRGLVGITEWVAVVIVAAVVIGLSWLGRRNG